MSTAAFKAMRPWLVIAMLAPVGFYVGQASLAASPSAAGLIDKEFERAVHKHFSKRFYNRIGASDEQRQALDGLWLDTSDKTRPLREQLRAGVVDLSQLFAAEDATDEQIVKKAHELRTLHEQVMDERLNSLLKARKVLSKEQKEQISDRIKSLITGGGSLLQRRLTSLQPGILENVD